MLRDFRTFQPFLPSFPMPSQKPLHWRTSDEGDRLDSVKIEHQGLVNVVRTDLPAGSALRMTMNGAAQVLQKRSGMMIREGFSARTG